MWGRGWQVGGYVVPEVGDFILFHGVLDRVVHAERFKTYPDCTVFQTKIGAGHISYGRSGADAAIYKENDGPRLLSGAIRGRRSADS